MSSTGKGHPDRGGRDKVQLKRFVIPYLREAIVHIEEIPLPRERADVAISERTKRLPLLAEHVDIVPRTVALASRQSGRRRDRTAMAPAPPRPEEVELEEEGSIP